ncbi:glycosyltransferase family A protein [Lutibacter sp. HS1-25]|uniref:glycosyltransferase family 2 protein n=1 Tax=Lutibacter sp. HS1-25 TaxID=2485000 RepID=UPI0013E90EF7|nr:glycosyltransferase family A protein [Lutibacter sp. HS1-25]
MSEIIISLITPAYNPGEFILETFDSLENQTFKNFEWIIVDDASNKKNQLLFDKISEVATFKVLIIRNSKNLLQSKSKNIGLKKAKGKFIKFIDADDLIDCEHLENQYNLIKNSISEHIAVFSPTHNFVGSIHSKNSHINLAYKEVETKNLAQLKKFIVQPFFHHCSCLFNRDDLFKINGFDENLITDEDGDLIIRLMLNGMVFLLCETSYYYYRHHNLSRVSRNNSNLKWEHRLKVCEKIENSLNIQNIDLYETLAQRLDNLGLESFKNNEEMSHVFFRKAEKVYPNYSFSGNKYQNIVRKLVGINMMFKIKGLLQN